MRVKICYPPFMDRARVPHFLALGCLLGVIFFSAAASAAPTLRQANQQVCEDALADFRDNPAWLDELRDPVLNSVEEIRERVNRYGTLQRCLASGGVTVSGDMLEVDRLLTLFMLFAGGSLFPEAQAGAQNFTLTFADIQDPAVRTLRDDLGIPPPPGLIYIWLYPSHNDLPDALRGYVQASSVRGLTLQTRYIVVFDGVQPGVPLEAYQRSKRSAVFSHEFVHAYIKAYLGPERGFSLPTWYDEGLAIYLSGSSEATSATYFDQNGRQVTWSVPPKEYARYRDDFLYLEYSLGREQFLNLIRRSILESSPDLLLRGAGLANEAELFSLAEARRIRRGLTRLGLLAGIPLFAGLLFLAVHFMWKKRADRIWSPPLQSPVVSPANQVYARKLVDHSQPEERLAGLVQQLHRRDEPDQGRSVRERYFAALALAGLNDLRAGEALIGALQDDSAEVRAAAARGLGEWSARLALNSRLEQATRARVLGRLFPLLDRDPANEVRWAAAEAIYQAGGAGVMRSIRAAVRRWSSTGEDAAALHQGWYVLWLIKAAQPQLLVDEYPWCGPAARQAIIQHLRSLPAADQERLLAQAQRSADPAQRELVDAVCR